MKGLNIFQLNQWKNFCKWWKIWHKLENPELQKYFHCPKELLESQEIILKILEIIILIYFKNLRDFILGPLMNWFQIIPNPNTQHKYKYKSALKIVGNIIQSKIL